MSHDYSVQIHSWITQKIEDIKWESLSAEEENKEMKEYLAGKLDELLFFQQYLTEKIDLETQNYYK